MRQYSRLMGWGAAGYWIDGRLNDSFKAANLLLAGGVKMQRIDKPSQGLHPGDWVVPSAPDALVASVAKQTGGEYFDFKDSKSLVKRLELISNDMPAYYVLTFTPQAPHPGLHALSVSVPSQPSLSLTARKAYWAASPATPPH